MDKVGKEMNIARAITWMDEWMIIVLQMKLTWSIETRKSKVL
jgi:hypothetical protein